MSLKARFRPEFLNRLDEDPRSKNKWIRVNRLRRQDIVKIASLQIAEFKDLLVDRHDTELVIDPSVIDFLAIEGFSPLYGARPMTAAIEKHIIDPMAKWILEEAAQGRKNVRGGLIKIRAEGGRIVFAAEAKPDKKIERSGVEGAARQVAAEVFALIERFVGDGEAGGALREPPRQNDARRASRRACGEREEVRGGAGSGPSSLRVRL